MRSRILIIFIVLSSIWLSFILKASLVQILPNPRLETLKEKQFKKKVVLRSRRGAIYDRNGRELAVSIDTYSLFADPKVIRSRKKVARRLASYLDRGVSYIENKIKSNRRRFVWIERHLSEQQKKKILSWNIRGLGFVEESKRIYPNGSLLSQTLGFTGSENQGLEGLEVEYDSLLRGPRKKLDLHRDARGRILLMDGGLLTHYADGSNLVLTIDREIQYRLERELRQTLKNFDADGAYGIILDANTSEILALASLPDYDPNRALYSTNQLRRNRVITDAFEPGSTMKTFTIAAALRAGRILPSTKVDCENGRTRVGNRWIREADSKHKFGVLSVSDILAFSSNVGATKIGLSLGAEELRQTLLDFGFGRRPRVRFPGQSNGILHPLPWKKHSIATISFGHGVTASPLQIANAYATIANGGLLKSATLIKEVSDPLSGKARKLPPPIPQRVLTPEQARIMRLMLSGVTAAGGTGFGARVNGFPVAGKTGTAQKVNPKGRGYLPGAYVSSFAGIFPANNPKFVIYVAVDQPRKAYYGSEVAVPVFSQLAQFLVRHSGLSPAYVNQESVIAKGRPQADRKLPVLSQSKDNNILPNLIGLNLRQALQLLERHKVKIKGAGWIVRTQPAAGENVKAGSVVQLSLRDRRI